MARLKPLKKEKEMGLLSKIFGKRKISKEEFVECILPIEKKWTEEWIKFFKINYDLHNVTGIKLESHIISLYIVSLTMPNDYMKDVMFNIVAERIGDDVGGGFWDHLSKRFEEYNNVFNSPILFPQAIVASINDHLEKDIRIDMLSMPKIFSTFQNMQKATLRMIEQTLDKFDVDRLGP